MTSLEDHPRGVQILFSRLMSKKRGDLVRLDRDVLSSIFEVSVSLPEEALNFLTHALIIGQPSKGGTAQTKRDRISRSCEIFAQTGILRRSRSSRSALYAMNGTPPALAARPSTQESPIT